MADLVEVDSRRRITLGRLAAHGDRYLVSVEPGGTIVLTPAVVMSEAEARLLANPELVGRLKSNRVDPGRMKHRRTVG